MNNTVATRLVSWTAYPLVMVSGLLVHYYFQRSGLPVFLSAYASVVLSAMAVSLLEWHFPYQPGWRPNRDDVRQDLLYMILVQMALPKILTLLAVLLLITPIREMGLPMQDWWPHHAPLWAQVVLMVLLADFLRYWLHRAAHEYSPLWQIHAVHHSPPRLYWLNVGRFHPLDKGLQFLLDVLPFLVFAVDEVVVATYFVFYAVNGFFQHSNIRLNYGILNYVISGAELHRWHHSRLTSESNRNYGNNVIIWDLLFGTWYLPADRRITDIGLQNHHYPLRFLPQMLAPFTPGLTKQDVPLKGLGEYLKQFLLVLKMKRIYWFDVSPLLASAKQPEQSQEAVLQRLLSVNEETRFGREHNFSGINSYADFVRQVPVTDYEELRPYIDRQDAVPAADRHGALTAEQPLMYAVTSGTTGDPKYIPIVATNIQQFKREQRIFSWIQFQDCPAAFKGKILVFSGAAVEGHRPSGRPYGSVSGYLYKCMPRLVQQAYVIPPAVFEITDYPLKYRTMLRLALAEQHLSFIAAANPSSLLRFLNTLEEGDAASRSMLIDSIERGGFPELEDTHPAIYSSIKGRLEANKPRADQLRQLLTRTRLTFSDIWPEIRLLTVWTGGSCGIPLGQVKALLPPKCKVVELGYLSSELRVTITIDTTSGQGLPVLRHVFFEFAPVREWDAGERGCLRLEQLELGQQYYVIVTTASGLYRYFMNDIIEVGGRYEQTPTLTFVRKGRGVTNITGEKLYEDQVICALQKIEQDHGFRTVFIMMLADEAESGYHLYLECEESDALIESDLGTRLDSTLGAVNMEYQAKRDSGRLQPLRVHLLKPNTADACKAFFVNQGQREGQFKLVCLQYQNDFHFDLSPHLLHP